MERFRLGFFRGENLDTFVHSVNQTGLSDYGGGNGFRSVRLQTKLCFPYCRGGCGGLVAFRAHTEWKHTRSRGDGEGQYPNAPCREYLPTFPLECGHFSPNVGKYSLHGASGVVLDLFLLVILYGFDPMVKPP